MAKLSPAQLAILRRMGKGDRVCVHTDEGPGTPPEYRHLTWNYAGGLLSGDKFEFNRLIFARLVTVEHDGGLARTYAITPAGRAYLEEHDVRAD